MNNNKNLIKIAFSFFLTSFILCAQAKATSIYDISVLNSAGKKVALSDYKNKVLMIVNVASRCGNTKQYAGLEDLYKKYNAKGLMILGFPSNEFGSQEPGTNEEIQKFCKLTYGVTLPVMGKTTVNGSDASELYKWLTSQEKFKGPITWNFNKFILDKKGNPVQRFESSVTPKETEDLIIKLTK